MKCEDGFRYGITIEYEGQAENLIAKCQMEHNAYMIAHFMQIYVNSNPIVRVVDLEEEKQMSASRKEMRYIDQPTAIFK